MTATFISLFAGIGGIDLGMEAAGWQCIGQVEIDDFCTTILEKRWPHVPRWRDIRTCTGRTGKGWRRYHHLPRPDALAGGFPCQDISTAGKGAGIRDGTRSGLWYEFARLIGELRPRIVLLENVPAITARDGNIVIGDLAAMGYDARWGTLRASDAGATHRRERWFCVAYNCRVREQQPGGISDSGWGWAANSGPAMANAIKSRLAERQGQPGKTGPSGSSPERTSDGPRGWLPQPRLGRNVNGLSAWMDRSYAGLHVAGRGEQQRAWELPRITARREHRTSRLKALGNAVVPQVIYPLAVYMRELLEVTV